MIQKEVVGQRKPPRCSNLRVWSLRCRLQREERTTTRSRCLYNYTWPPERPRETSHLYYKRTSGFNTAHSRHITSGHRRQSNPIKMYLHLLGQTLSSLSCCQFSTYVRSSSRSQSARVSARGGNKRGSSWKEVFGFVLSVSEVYPEGWEVVRRIKKYERKSRQHSTLNSLPQIHEFVCVSVWPVQQNAKAHCERFDCFHFTTHLERLYRCGFVILWGGDRCQFNIMFKESSQLSSFFL